MSFVAAPARRLEVAEVPRFAVHELAAAADDRAIVAVLENPGEVSELGRWAYFCCDPIWRFFAKRSREGPSNQHSRCWAGPPGAELELDVPVLDALAELLERGRGDGPCWRPGLPPFVGGALGYLGYELLHLIEEVPDRGRDDLALPDIELDIFDVVFATDLAEGRSFVLATGFGPDAEAAALAAASRLAEALALLEQLLGKAIETAPTNELRERAAAARAAHPRLCEADLLARGVRPTIDKGAYLDSIARIQAEILAGNAFEVCLTQRFDVELEPAQLRPNARSLYEVLRAVNPAPMSAYLRLPTAEILSASPERFVRVDRSGLIETRPIKGTRARDVDPREDRALAEDLRGAEKDRAENLMIVDLCRNDLGKLARFGSVRVTELCAVLPYAYTWQMVSTIEARLREGTGPVDVLRACFPGGSMTGAPKIEALKIIEALEPTDRGVFSGAIGVFDFDGALDLSIVIRTLIRVGSRLSFHVGGAIVADSEAEAEYQETLDKAHGLIMALDLALDGDRARGGQ